MKRNLNQKLINLVDYYNLINANFFLSDTPIKRFSENTTYTFTGTKFEQLSIDLNNLQSGIIKQPKLQETSTLILLKCVYNIGKSELANCYNTKKEIITVLNRRIILPFYIPIISIFQSFYPP